MKIDKINIDDIKEIVIHAGKEVMKIYQNDLKINYKNDGSPVTQADLISNKIICDFLKTKYPSIPLLSEENKEIDYSVRKNWDCYWCIDPLDGTKDFLNKNNEFTINVALVYKNKPYMGVVYAPAYGDLYHAQKDKGAFKNNTRLPQYINKKINKDFKVVVSRSHFSKETREFIENLECKNAEYTSMGSSLKLCLIAEGSFDIYPRLEETKEWDTAASHIIINEVSRKITQYEKNETILYNKKNLANPWFIAK